MGIYTRTDSPFYWKKFDRDPETGTPPRKPSSTGIRVSAPTTKQAAQNKADAEIQYQQDCIDIRKGVYGPAAPIAGKPAILLRDYSKEWLATHAIHHGSYQSEISVCNILNAHLGDCFLTDITVARVEDYRTERVTVDGVKARTADREVSVLISMLSKATTYLDSNPIGGRNAMGQRKLRRLRWADFEARWFTRAEFDRFLATIQAHDAILDTPRAEGLALALTAIQTLLRCSSLMKLTWQDYRAAGASQRYPFAHFIPRDAKVSLPYAAINTQLLKYLDALPRDTPGGLVFASHYRNIGKHASDDPLGAAGSHAGKWFVAVCRLAGIPCTRAKHGVTFHSLRHTGASWLLGAGVSVDKVMKIGGWRSSQLFIKTYCHADAEEVAAESERVFGKVAPFVTPAKATTRRRKRGA